MNKQSEGDNSTRVVIVGTGFAGMNAYLELHKLIHGHKNIFITIINRNDYFLFVPMIHEVAVGNLLPGSITQSVRVLPQCCLDDFIEGEVVSIDLDAQKITYQNTHTIDNHNRSIKKEIVKYDYLILAPGSTTNFFGTDGAEKYSIPLKDLDGARRIKNHILHRFEEAQTISNQEERKKLLTFVIVGGGATGVELAGEMADVFQKELKRIYPELYSLSSVVLIQAGKQLISPSAPWFAKKTKDILEKKGKINIKLNSKVVSVDDKGVDLEDERIQARTIIWTAGVMANEIEFSALRGVKKDDRSRRVHTNKHIQIPNYKNVFPVGDYAWIPQKDTDAPYPTRAQFAVEEGRTAARNILFMIKNKEELETFYIKDKGFIVSLGKGGALAYIFGTKLSGPIAWWVYRTAYLVRIVGIRAKLRTVLEWTLNLFLPRDLSEL